MSVKKEFVVLVDIYAFTLRFIYCFSEGRCNIGSQFKEYQSLYEATKVERDKLLELVSMLQQR